jgi:hypothetical protein
MLDELVDRRQMCRVAYQMVEGDEGLRLATAVGQLQLPDRLLIFTDQVQQGIFDQFTG